MVQQRRDAHTDPVPLRSVEADAQPERRRGRPPRPGKTRHRIPVPFNDKDYRLLQRDQEYSDVSMAEILRLCWRKLRLAREKQAEGYRLALYRVVDGRYEEFEFDINFLFDEVLNTA